MTKTGEERKAPAKGKPTLQAALLLLVIGVLALVAQVGALGGLFILGAVICGIVGLIQKESAGQ